MHLSSSDAGGKPAETSQRIVHVEFDRVRGHLEALDFGHLQLDEAVDEVVVEHAAGLEERAVLVEIFQRFAERTADRRDRLQLFLRQIIEVLVHRRTRINLVLDAIEAASHRTFVTIAIARQLGEAREERALKAAVRKWGSKRDHQAIRGMPRSGMGPRLNGGMSQHAMAFIWLLLCIPSL